MSDCFQDLRPRSSSAAPCRDSRARRTTLRLWRPRTSWKSKRFVYRMSRLDILIGIHSHSPDFWLSVSYTWHISSPRNFITFICVLVTVLELKRQLIPIEITFRTEEESEEGWIEDAAERDEARAKARALKRLRELQQRTQVSLSFLCWNWTTELISLRCSTWL